MCGRIVQATSPEEIAREFGAVLADARIFREWQPRWNIAPTSRALIILPGGATTNLTLTSARWGLVPHWAKDESLGNRLFNARAETVERLPSFRDAFKAGRAIVPIDAFYEWENPEHMEALGTPIPKKAPKQPWAFMPANGRRFALAGLASVRSRSDGPPLRTFTLITTEANAVVGSIHDRMPVMLDDAHQPDYRYMDPAVASIAPGIHPGSLVIFETTLPVGDTRGRFLPKLEAASSLVGDRDLFVAFSPERLYSGAALRNLATYPKLVGGVGPALGQIEGEALGARLLGGHGGAAAVAGRGSLGRRRRLGADADTPHRIKYRKLTR